MKYFSFKALENKLKDVVKENDALIKENRKLKDELNGLDESFFEEIEDLKYALHQSTKLNQKYEETLKHICKQYDLNYKKTIQQHVKMSSTPKS